MPAVSFSGIASGIDTDSLIQATLDAARATKVAPKQTKKTEISDQNDALTTLKTKLTTLQNSVQTFRTVNGGGVARSATSSDDSVATATASSGITNASYNVTVTQLAEPARIVFPDDLVTYASTSALIGAAGGTTMRFTFNTPVGAGEVVDYAAGATTTVADLVNGLNSNTTFAAFAEATLVNVGTPAAAAYRLVVSAKKTGEAAGGTNAIEYSEMSGGLSTPPTVTDGKNSRISIAGIGTNIERYTNDLTDVIPGLNISIRDTGTTKLTVGVDVTATTTRIKDFIEAYNDIIAFLQLNNTVERQESGKDVTNVYAALAKTSLDENLLSLMRNDLSGARSTSGTSIRIFADMGITTDSGAFNAENKTGGGTLKLDSDAVSSSLQRSLANALALEPDSVEELLEKFGEAIGNITTGTIAQFVNFNRLLDTTINSNKSQISDLDSRIAEAEKQLARQEESLKARYARLEGLMGRLQSQGNTLSSALAGIR